MYDDGNFSNAQEIAGTEALSVDPITKSITVVRKYIQDARMYRFNAGAIGVLRDIRYPRAVLTGETSGGINSGLQEFTRTFTEIPASRTEYEQIAFTYPGRSRVFFSRRTSQPINWDKYGMAAPATKLVNARAEYSYSLTSFAPIQQTLITYQGQSVDFCGDVYVPVGSVDIGGGVTEERWQRDGSTTPYIAPASYIVSVSITRYNGPIFERKVVHIP